MVEEDTLCGVGMFQANAKAKARSHGAGGNDERMGATAGSSLSNFLRPEATAALTLAEPSPRMVYVTTESGAAGAAIAKTLGERHPGAEMVATSKAIKFVHSANKNMVRER